ncbi:MAG: mechanosensitive ion channel family protein [Nitrospirota bacterium]|nr:mechanosensitive ion channel family protein [Nitrospirota bacterium]
MVRTAHILIILLSLIGAQDVFAQTAPAPNVALQQEPETAPVVVDNVRLFYIRGFKALPAEERASDVAERIKKVALNQDIKTDSIIAVDSEFSIDIMAGQERIIAILDADAAIEGLPRKVVGEEYLTRIREAVTAYRSARTPERIVKGAVYSFFATIILIVLILAVLKIFTLLHSFLEARYQRRITSPGMPVLKIIPMKHIWSAIIDSLKIVRFFLILLLVYLYLERVLNLFPGTRHYAAKLLYYVLNPLRVMGSGILREIPDILFLVVLIFILRLYLRFQHIFFGQVEEGALTISGFYPEWAKPTDRLLTFIAIALAAVVAFPYIPGSETGAFKGISIFVGVLFSLGSQSAVSNFIAGFVVSYRRAFKPGDRVQIGEVIGDVTDIQMQSTRIRTIKNEEVIIPSSTILNSNVVNFSSFARGTGLILHATVSIGYDAPWRQVHELLLMAAGRTSGLLREPAPFVLQKSLDDFYVTYELNAYTKEPERMARIYSEMNRNIQDCFNEYGVQIMSPHYRGDPAGAKIVPKDKWYEPPAQQSKEGG